MEFDHIAIAGETLAEARQHVETSLGVSMQTGGEHAVYGTHNALLGVAEGLYLEAIAVNPATVAERRPRWFDLDRFAGGPRLSNWICRCDDLDETLASLPEGFGTPVALQRGNLRWRMAVPADGILPFSGCAPALIEWEGDAHPSALLPASGTTLTMLTVSHPQVLELPACLSPFLSDARIRFVQGPAGLSAAFDTGGKQCALT